MEPYLRRARLWYAAQVSFYEYNTALINAFQLGPRVDVQPVSGCTSMCERYHDHDIWTMCYDLFGTMPSQNERNGYSIFLSWFSNSFHDLELDASREIVVRHTRAYIMQMLGGFLMVDKLGSRVHLRWLPLLHDFEYFGSFSWGFVVLLTLYRNLCLAVNKGVRDISRCLAIL